MDAKLHQRYRLRIIYFYSLIILILLAWVSVSALFAYWILSISHGNSRLWLFALFPILYALFAVGIFLCYKPHKSRGLSVTKESAPVLFNLIENTARSVGYKGIIEDVVLTPGMSVSVNYNPNLANFVLDSKSTLHIGVLLCQMLSKEELSAAIAHELAHFSQPQTKYKAYLARISNIASSLGSNGYLRAPGESKPILVSLYALPARLLCKLFNYLFESIFNINSAEYIEITAEMEFEADKIAAQTFGADVMLSALYKVYGTSSRMIIYKTVVLPYISSYGYRCNGFWNTFEASSSLFQSIDGLEIYRYKRLLDLNRGEFDLSEGIFVLRCNTLEQFSGGVKYELAEEDTIDVVPISIQKKMDKYLCRKYRQDFGIPISAIRLDEILQELRRGLFTDVNSMPEAFVIVNSLLDELASNETEVKQTVLPEYVSPSYDVLPQPIVRKASEFVYTSSSDRCPVCGCEISEDARVCPHCHEIISE